MAARRLIALADAQTEWPWATTRYLRRAVAERRVPHHKIRGRVWFDAADLDAHADAGRVEPPGVRLQRRARAS